jgi:hypothetical protein
MTNTITTTNIADFSNREILQASDILKAYAMRNWRHPYFYGEPQLMKNNFSGFVFLVDEGGEGGNVLMLNGGELEGFYTSPYEGMEGFFSELLDEYKNDNMHREDMEWFEQLAQDLGEEI